MDTSILPEDNNDDQAGHAEESLEDQDIPFEDHELTSDAGEPDWDEPETANVDDQKHTSSGVALAVQDKMVRFFNSFSSGAPAPANVVKTRVTRAYVDALEQGQDLEPEVVESELLDILINVIKLENQRTNVSTEKIGLPKQLNHWQIARLLIKLHHVIRIAPMRGNHDQELDVIGVYVAEGEDAGTYSTEDTPWHNLARKYNSTLTQTDLREVEGVLRDTAPRRHRTTHRDLVPMNNGIFHYGKKNAVIEIDGVQHAFKAKTLHPFNPDLVFVMKSGVNFVADATSPHLTDPVTGHQWEIHAWIEDMWVKEILPEDDEETKATKAEFNRKNEGMAELVWQVLGGLLRPYVSWNKSAWFVSEKGNNGKGSICSLGRNLVGHKAHTSVSLMQMGSDTYLEDLVKAHCIITDENDVEGFVDSAANYKAIVTNDVIKINRKYKKSIAFQFFGLMVQCLNDLPKFSDKSESKYRRDLIMRFDKSFTGREVKAIKNDFLQRREVLEYVAKHVLLDMEYYEFNEPEAVVDALAEYKEHNDPVRGFWEEHRIEFEWELLPFTFLYDMYKVWFSKRYPSGKVLNYAKFVQSMVGLLPSDAIWECEDKTRKIRPGNRMSTPEPFIDVYDLSDWANRSFADGDPRRWVPILKPNYRGVQRRANAVAAGALSVSTPTSSTATTTDIKE